MELYFIRHGQSVNNAYWGKEDYQDVSDPELTATGHAQVKQLANFLRINQPRDESANWNSQNEYGFGITHIYTSLMIRAVSTAVPIAQALNLSLNAWLEVHETGGIFSRLEGDNKVGLPGKSRAYFEKNHPTLNVPDWLDEKGWWNRPFEDREARKPRAESVWREILSRHGDKPDRPEHRVVIISHGGFFNYLLTSALGVHFPPVDEYRHKYWFLMNNCAISRLDYDNEQVLICYSNRHEFLTDSLIT